MQPRDLRVVQQADAELTTVDNGGVTTHVAAKRENGMELLLLRAIETEHVPHKLHLQQRSELQLP